MFHSSLLSCLLFAAGSLFLLHSSAIVPAGLARESSSDEAGQVGLHVAKLMEQAHFTRTPFDDTMSVKVFQNYIESLDYARLYFTQSDIEQLRKQYARELDDYILLGNPKPAYEIFDLYLKRMTERAEKINKVLEANNFTFDSNKTVQINRQKVKAPWPKDEAEADQLWRDRLEAELLGEKLSEARGDQSAEGTKEKKDADKLKDPEAKIPDDGDGASGKEEPKEAAAKKSDVKIVINGRKREFAHPPTLLSILADAGIPPKAALVELDGNALHQDQWPDGPLADGAKVEILRIVAGG